MAGKAYKCINFGLCSRADARESIESDSDTGECPECGKPLEAGAGKSGSASGAFPIRKAGIGAAGALALFGGLYAFLPSDPEAPEPTPAPVVEPEHPLPAPALEPVPSPAPDPAPIPTPVPAPEPPPEQPPVKAVPPVPGPKRAPADPPSPSPVEPAPAPAATDSGPSSGRIVWEGEIEDKEGLVTIEGSNADKGRVLSGALPGGVPVVLALHDIKNIGIAMTPQPTSSYKRLVLRVKKGKRRAVVDWSVAR